MDRKPTHMTCYLPWDNAPLDLSFVFANEKPAGRHGFLQARGFQFVFEDGTPARFWGTNFNAGACFPPKEQAPLIARRLAMFGLNIVRFHQMDSEWARPSLFQYEKGPLLENTQSFDPRSLELLDYFISCLKNEGVYVYLDLLTYRQFREGDELPNATLLPLAAKPYCLFDRRLIELQKQFNHNLLNHFNPYTGLAYKDEPCIAMTELINEASFFYSFLPVTIEPYRHELCDLYRVWATGINLPAKPDEELVFDLKDEVICAFFLELMRRYNRELIDDLKALGVKYPLTGTNQTMSVAVAAAQDVCDFVDNHEYMWISSQTNNVNINPLGVERSFGSMLSLAQLPDKPLFISEWDSTWPNQYRAAATLHLAGLISFQGWGGAAVHTYRYGNNVEDWLTRRMGRDLVICDSESRGCFDTYNDPAKFGLFYHAALIVRRGDLAMARQVLAVEADLLADNSSSSTALTYAPELHRVVMQMPGCSVQADQAVNIRDTLTVPEEIISDTGEMGRNPRLGNGWIDTPMTRACYGQRRRHEQVQLKGLKIQAENDFYTLAISSLTADPIETSGNLLLTAVGLADNKGARYSGDFKVQIDQGEGPLEMEVIRASIELETTLPYVRILSIDHEGFVSSSWLCQADQGRVKFSIGDKRQTSTLYFLIQKP